MIQAVFSFHRRPSLCRAAWAVYVTRSPSQKSGHSSMWTGSQMRIWGGSGEEKGGKYSP
jgi:hypothetical protein